MKTLNTEPFSVEELEATIAPGYCDWTTERGTGGSVVYALLTAGIGGYIDFLACW